MELAYPPFEMRGTDNQPDGISVRMAEDLAASLGRPLKIVDVAWDGIIPSLMTGEIDLIISSMTRTEERAESIDFSDGYVTNGLCMLVASDSEIKSVDDLPESGLTVAVKLATTGWTWAREELEGVELTVLDEATTCALEVVQGKADAFIYDQISIYRHWKQNEDTTRPILEPIREETWAIGIKKGNDALRAEVNAFLKEYREAGKFDELAERYMKAEREEFKKLGVPFIFH
jgi:polar amino acid transport system substrate-binding protein